MKNTALIMPKSLPDGLDVKTQMRIWYIALQGILAVIVIGPFAIFRFLHDEPAKGLADTVISLSMVAVALYVFYGNGYRHAKVLSYFYSAIYVLGCIIVVHISEVYTIMWIYPAAIGCYFVLNAKPALVYSAVLLIGVVAAGQGKFTLINWVIIGSAFVITCVFAFALSVQGYQDRKTITNHNIYDILTGAKSRPVLMQELESAILATSNKPVSVLLIDIDNFNSIHKKKHFNQGDQTIVSIVKTANNHLKPSENIYRYSGDEFFIVTELDITEAKALARKIHHSIQQLVHPDYLNITVSIGVAQHKSGETLGCLLHGVEQAVVTAKKNGGDQVYIA